MLQSCLDCDFSTLRQLMSSPGAVSVPPFEFRALEVALEAICSFLEARTKDLESTAHPALDALTKKVSSRNLDQVRKMKSAMTRLTARVQKVRDELEQLLDDDDDMADLFLSRKALGAVSPAVSLAAPNWAPTSPTIGSRVSRVSKASTIASYAHGTGTGADDVEELEMLLEVRLSRMTFSLVTWLSDWSLEVYDFYVFSFLLSSDFLWSLDFFWQYLSVITL
jgi:magnesium transporter